MDMDVRRGGLLGVVWLLTGVCAFLLGYGKSDRIDRSQGEKHGDPNSSDGRRSSAAADAAKDSSKSRRAHRKANTVGRFISVTRRLSDDELVRLLPEITEKMSLAEVLEAFARLEKVRAGPGRRLAKLELINRYGQLDAQGAFKQIEAMAEAEPELRIELVYQAVKGWASVDPAKAHAHVLNTKGSNKESLRAVWEGLAKTNDLAKTLAYITELGPGSNGYSQPYEIWDVYMTLHELFAKDDKTVIAWVEELPPGETRDRSFHSIVDQLARHDPVAAKEWIDEQAAPSNITEAYVELAESWARHDPEAAVEWAASLPANTNDLRRIYERLFTRFIQYDFLDAAKYLVEQEPSPALDTAFEVYIEKVKGIDPASTMDWAVAITDDGRRWAAIQQVASVWRGQDPNALGEYVRGLELSEGQQNTLLGK